MNPTHLQDAERHVQGVERYFDSLAGNWEKHYGEAGSMRNRLERFRAPLLKQVRPPAVVLDFGCGSGDLSAYMAEAGYLVHAVDQSREMVERARRRFDVATLEFSAVENGRLPFSDGRFQACVSSSVLEYVAPLESYLRELRRVLVKGGSLWITVPNAYHPVRVVEGMEKTVWSWVPSASRLWPEGRERYLKASVNRLSLPEWRRKLAAEDWQVESIEGVSQALVLIRAMAV